ncbi:hypothetical protein ACH3Y9_41120 [Streptomyces sp. WSLK1-5]
MIGLFREALPEFLGSLCATLVVTIGTWTARKARSRAVISSSETTSDDE